MEDQSRLQAGVMLPLAVLPQEALQTLPPTTTTLSLLEHPETMHLGREPALTA